MKTHIELIVIVFFSIILPTVIFAGTEEEKRRERTKPAAVIAREYEELLKIPGVSRGRQSLLFEDQFTDPDISRIFMNGNYCNDYPVMQDKLRKWRRKWLLEGPEEFCALGQKGVKVWKYNKKDRAILIKKGARPNFLYGVKYIGKWTEKDQRKLERQLDAQESIYLRQLKIEERRARRQVEQWPAEWEQKEKEFLDGFKDKEYEKWLEESDDELGNLISKHFNGTVRHESLFTPLERERLNFLHNKLRGKPFVPPAPRTHGWPEID